METSSKTSPVWVWSPCKGVERSRAQCGLWGIWIRSAACLCKWWVPGFQLGLETPWLLILQRGHGVIDWFLGCLLCFSDAYLPVSKSFERASSRISKAAAKVLLQAASLSEWLLVPAQLTLAWLSLRCPKCLIVGLTLPLQGLPDLLRAFFQGEGECCFSQTWIPSTVQPGPWTGSS